MIFRCILHGITYVNVGPFVIAGTITFIIRLYSKKYQKPKRHTVIVPRMLTFAYSTNLCAIAMYYDLFVQTEKFDVFLLIVIVALSGMFNNYPCDHLIFLVAFLGISIIIETHLAPRNIFMDDLFNVVIATVGECFSPLQK